jgi:orotidine-5'-phosphate decarboxylase
MEPLMDAFGARLTAAIDARGRLCVGIDPHPRLLTAWGLRDDVHGLETFTMSCVEALADTVAVLKPQSAFFERRGAAGVAVLERAVGEARSRGALVLLDAKRGDIGSTMQGYADAYVDQTSPLAVDAITVNPFLGFEALRPMLDSAHANGAGVFVLAMTSNPEGPEIQRAHTATGTVATDILRAVAAENTGRSPMGSIGAVVGATVAQPADLQVNGPLLAPGLGAQGGTVEDLARLFAGVAHLVLPSTSRAVLAHGPDPAALRAAARRTADSMRALR